MSTCKVCNGSLSSLFETTVLNKYNVAYYQCRQCEFIQTEQPYWLTEAYGNAITSLDIGLVNRNEVAKPIVKAITHSLFKGKGKYVDYGGGYGMFVRMMRDSGLDYYRQDIYCDNLFAKHFDVTDLQVQEKSSYAMLTAFEVFEHLEDPMEEIQKMLQYSSTIFFSTLLVPPQVNSVSDWWYFIPGTGQHIALYSKKSLEYIAQKNGLRFYTNNINYHCFTKKKISPLLFKWLTTHRVANLYSKFFTRKQSLLQQDFNYINQLNK